MRFVTVVMLRERKNLRKTIWQAALALNFLLVVIASLSGATATGQPATAPKQRLLTLSYQDVPLREAITGLQNATGWTVLLDRRIDPTQQVSLIVDKQPADEALTLLADSISAGYSRLQETAYIGPAHRARQLRTLTALLEQRTADLPAPARSRWQEARELTWPRLSEPQQLLSQLTAEAQTELTAGESVPHDLWDSGRLPDLPLTDRFALLLIQFDLGLAISRDGTLIRYVPLPEEVRIQRSYPAGSNPATKQAQWQELAPAAEITQQGNTLLVRARQEDHELLAETETRPAAPARPRTARTKAPEQNYQLRVRDIPLENLLKQLAERLELQFTFSSDLSADQLQMRVSVEIADASLTELLSAVLSPAGLEFSQQGQQVTVSPAR